MSNLLNILQHKEAPIENEQILDYLKGQLQHDVEHRLESAEQEDVLIKDALEGLQMMEDKTRLDKLSHDLNRHLQQRIAEQRTKRKEVTKWKDQPWILMAAITLILLILISFVVMSKLHHP